MNIEETINKAKETGSYFITCTIRDKKRTENDLNHFIFRKEFDIADIVPSLDNCIKQMDISLKKPVDVIIPPKVVTERDPLKIAIITHFNRAPESYSPARAVKNQVKMLQKFNHEVVFFTQEGSKLDLGCEMRAVVPKFKREKMIVNEEMKNKFIEVLKKELVGFDIAITHDLFLQDTVTYSEAIRECGVDIPWLHFARSGIGHDMTFNMPNAKFVYLNYCDIGRFAQSIKVKPEQCRTVFNEKEIFFMYNFHPVTQMIIKKFRLWERDIIMTYPVCSTRLSAKGVRDIIRVFVELKRLGNKVALILPNANGRKRADDLRREQQVAKEYGLNEDEFIFTSLLADEEYAIESEVPNQVCAELMQVSNLFIAASKAEVGPNTVLEASMAKNLIVINEDLPLFYDFVNKKTVLSYPFSSNQSIHYFGRREENYNKLAKQIIGRLKEDWADRQFRFVWRQHNMEAIYRMLERVLYEDVK